MNRLSVFFLTILSPLLSILLAWLGWQTLGSNIMGWFLLATGAIYFFGILVAYWIKRVPFWSMNKGKVTSEEKGDRSFWLILPGIMIPFFLSPVEFLYLPPLIPHDTGLSIGGLVLVGFAVILLVWARRATRNNYSGHLMVSNDQVLVQSGPYRLIRHPAYASFLGMSLGVGLGYSSLIGLCAVVILLIPAFIYRISVEEKLLIGQFGQQYLDYASKTARLIPGLW